jgi:hypothetical protein
LKPNLNNHQNLGKLQSGKIHSAKASGAKSCSLVGKWLSLVLFSFDLNGKFFYSGNEYRSKLARLAVRLAVHPLPLLPLASLAETYQPCPGYFIRGDNHTSLLHEGIFYSGKNI